MARRLILDTSVLVDSERGALDLRSVVADDDDVVIAAITLAELRTGVELSRQAFRERRERLLIDVLGGIPLEPYDEETAKAHAMLLAYVHRSGVRPGAHDLVIAATAVATRRTVVTSDQKARFADLPGVDSVVIERVDIERVDIE